MCVCGCIHILHGLHHIVQIYRIFILDFIINIYYYRLGYNVLQGFHDIVVTFLLVVGEDMTFAIMNKLCQKHLRYRNTVAIVLC